jgi:sterol desaturase/sphingolipid hydroxylase (fatty acid hydroxylase superfamily)
LWALGVDWVYRVLGMVVLVGWPLLMFSYLHDGMHLTGFWMERAPLLGSWFVRARRLHDIHHRTLNDDGKMDRNFGIGFFVFDRIFGTMKKRHSALNCKGYREALRRHVELGAEEELKSFPSEYRCE